MDAQQEKERIDVPPSEWEVSELLDILNGTGSAAFVLTLRRLAFQRDRLAAEVAELRRDALAAKLLAGWLQEHTGNISELERARDVVRRELEFDAALATRK